jgi:hypothetical protein
MLTPNRADRARTAQHHLMSPNVKRFLAPAASGAAGNLSGSGLLMPTVGGWGAGRGSGLLFSEDE